MDVHFDGDNFLSDYEMHLVNDAQVLLTKNRIIKTVIDRFAKIADAYNHVITNRNICMIEHIIQPKISRGENYKGLPYVVLDFPRQFGQTDTFAIRSFFWWGNFFSITLQLHGAYLHKYLPIIKRSTKLNLFDGWYIGCADTPWQHHFEEDNYRLILPNGDYDLSYAGHLKMAKKIPLKKWDEAETFFITAFSFLVELLNN